MPIKWSDLRFFHVDYAGYEVPNPVATLRHGDGQEIDIIHHVDRNTYEMAAYRQNTGGDWVIVGSSAADDGELKYTKIDLVQAVCILHEWTKDDVEDWTIFLREDKRREEIDPIDSEV